MGREKEYKTVIMDKAGVNLLISLELYLQENDKALVIRYKSRWPFAVYLVINYYHNGLD